MKKSYFFAGVSILFWSTVATVTKLLLNNGHNSIQVLWVSVFFAGMFLLVANIFTGKIKKFKEYTLKDFVISVLIGLPGTFFYYVFYYGGAAILPASQAFIVNYMWPIMSVVFACIILREKMTLKKGIAIAVSFLGVGIVTGKEILSFSANALMGVVLCLLGAVSYGLFTALNKKYHYDKMLSMMLNYFVSFTITTVINAAAGNLFMPTLSEAAGFAWNGIFTMAIACTTWVIALDKGNTAKISNLAYITPFLSLVWTWLILGDQGIKDPYSLIGLCVIVAGIFIQLINFKKPKDKEKN
ncbi:MAG: DMT family transporter [Clostridia bacterium]|nr:DMT family transporter [Clostridia bacterium]